MPTEDFVRNFGRRMHHTADEVIDGDAQGDKNGDFVVAVLQELSIAYLADVVGACSDEANLKQFVQTLPPIRC
jgi:hypothetical protein